LVVVIGLQLINIFAIQKRNFCLFKTTLIFSMLVWSLSTIWLHKDIFKAVVKANKYAQENLQGTIVYNDVSSVSDWYLNVKPGNDQVEGVYVNMDSRAGRTYEVLEEERADYVMVTNEHNTAMEFNADEVIVIPVYNEKDTVEALVKKVKAVDLDELQKEIVLIDDASSDGSVDILKKMQKEDPSLKGRPKPKNIF